jgi:hypothetical protein
VRAPTRIKRCSFLIGDLGEPLGRVADLDSLLRSSEAFFGGELVEQPH